VAGKEGNRCLETKKGKKKKKSHHIIQFLLAVSEGELSSFLSPMVYFRFSSSDGLSFTFLSFFFLFFFSFSFFFFRSSFLFLPTGMHSLFSPSFVL